MKIDFLFSPRLFLSQMAGSEQYVSMSAILDVAIGVDILKVGSVYCKCCL